MSPSVSAGRSPRQSHVLLALFAALLLVGGWGCSSPWALPVSSGTSPPTVEATSVSNELPEVEGLTTNQVATLSSLRKVSDHPLYTMRYEGDVAGPAAMGPEIDALTGTWACSLFAALGDPEQMVYGRNFDWEHSPALLLFTDPKDGYGSVSMVDIAYLGFRGEDAQGLTELPLEDLEPLLGAHRLPFDGMNDQGLVVGMAAVPDGGMRSDPAKSTIGSLAAIRMMLNSARNVEDAVAVLSGHNIDHGGGPAVHYLIADNGGRAVLAEFAEGELRVTPSSDGYHLATNFMVAPALDNAQGRCGRYDRIVDTLAWSGGKLGASQAMDLLADVAQNGTQWSVVYGMNEGTIDVVMGRQWDQVYPFVLD